MSERAYDELVALALKARPDWRDHDLRAGLAGAAVNGWEWDRALQETVRLVSQKGSDPRELAIASRDPLRPTGVSAPPSDDYRRIVETTLGSRGE